MVQLDLDLTDLTATLRRHGVAFALVFGSVAEGRSTDRSDIDLAVWGPTRIDRWSLGAALPTTIDLTLLEEAPDWLAGRVAMTGVVILDDDPAARVRWQAQTRKRYLDEAPRRLAFQRDFTQAHG